MGGSVHQYGGQNKEGKSKFGKFECPIRWLPHQQGGQEGKGGSERMKKVSDNVFVDAWRTVWLSSLFEVSSLGVVVRCGYLVAKTRRKRGRRGEESDGESKRRGGGNR